VLDPAAQEREISAEIFNTSMLGPSDTYPYSLPDSSLYLI
jgi:hypothetical protein